MMKGGDEELSTVPACVYCVAGINQSDWVEGKMVIKERPDE